MVINRVIHSQCKLFVQNRRFGRPDTILSTSPICRWAARLELARVEKKNQIRSYQRIEAGLALASYRHTRGRNPRALARSHHMASISAAPSRPIPKAIEVVARLEGSRKNFRCASGRLKIAT